MIPALTHGLNNSAMNHGTGYLAQDLAQDNITVNAIVPGPGGDRVARGWAENMGKQMGKTKQEFLDAACQKMGILAGRWASMEEVSGLVRSLPPTAVLTSMARRSPSMAATASTLAEENRHNCSDVSKAPPPLSGRGLFYCEPGRVKIVRIWWLMSHILLPSGCILL